MDLWPEAINAVGKHSRGFGLEASLFEKPVLGAGEAEVFPQGFAFVFAAEEAAPLQFGMTRSTNSSRPPGTYGNMMLKPSQALSGCTQLSAKARFCRASAAVSPPTTRAPGRIWMVGRANAELVWRATTIHGSDARRLLLLQQISSKIARAGCSRPIEIDGSVSPSRPHPDPPVLSG